jgi:hypothetical protein
MIRYNHDTRKIRIPDWKEDLLEVVWVILGVERVEYTHYCRLSCIPRGR